MRFPLTETVLDLYAGVGLFSVALAALGRTRITAVEGDRTSGRDLQRNATPFACGAARRRSSSVEDYLTRRAAPAATIIVDPPRTGMSREALSAVVRAGAATDHLRVVRSRRRWRAMRGGCSMRDTR